MKQIQAVVVSYNSEATITECLMSLRRAGITTHVVDNGSTDATVARVRATGIEPIQPGRNYGFGAGVNRAMREVDAPLALLVNPDCVVTSKCVSELSRALAADERLAAVVPRMQYPDGSFGVAGAAEPSLLKEWLAFLRADQLVPLALAKWATTRFRTRMLSYVMTDLEEGVRVVDWVCGWCMLIRVEAFRAIDGFDERYFLYFEDVDLSKRLRARGCRVAIVQSVSALHFESTSTSQSRKSAHYARGLRTYFQGSTRWQRWSSRLLANLMRA